MEDKLYWFIERAVCDELTIRPNQNPNTAAHAVAREVLRLLREHGLRITDIWPRNYDEDGENDDD